MGGSVAILGGSGFVGRHLAERWPDGAAQRPRFLLHRSRPEWLLRSNVDIWLADFSDRESMKAAFDGVSTVINLLRPDGSHWLLRVMEDLLPLLQEASVTRLVHSSSIDVYGATRVRHVTEATTPEPRVPYEMEHFRIERLVSSSSLQSCIVRPGAVFGQGGRNLVAFVPEVREGPHWRLALRRALYGRRRMHLVSVENVADALCHLATMAETELPKSVILTDDGDLENNFEFVQAAMMTAFGRSQAGWWPVLPKFLLRWTLHAARGRRGDPERRFSNDVLANTGFRPREPFAFRLAAYMSFLRDAENHLA